MKKTILQYCTRSESKKYLQRADEYTTLYYKENKRCKKKNTSAEEELNSAK